MRPLLSILVLSFALSPLSAFAAIQFDFMDSPAALSDEQRERLIQKLKEFDIEGLKGDLEEASQHLPENVRDLPSQATEKLEEQGIDATGIFSSIWGVFSNLGSWMVGLVEGQLDEWIGF